MTRLWKPDEQLPATQQISEKKPLRRWTPGEAPKPEENYLKSLGTGFEKALAGPAAGLLQIMGANDLADSVHNYWEKAYEKSKQANPYASMAGYGAGVVTPAIAVPFGGPAGLLGRTAVGAGIGGAQGFLDYTPDEESRLSNALRGAGYGAMGANIPAIGEGLFKTGKALTQLPTLITKSSSKMAKGVLNKFEQLEQKFTPEFNNFFEKNNQLIEKPKLISDKKTEAIAKRYGYDALGKFLRKPTVENAHYAQSEIGALERALKEKDLRRALTPNEETTLTNLQKNKKTILKAIKNNVGKEQYEAYSNLRKNYGKELGPYLDNANIKKYRAGKLTDEDFLKSIMSHKESKARLLPLHPEIEKSLHAKELMKDAREKILNILPFGVAGYGLHEILK